MRRFAPTLVTLAASFLCAGSAISASLPAPVRPTTFPLKRPTQEGTLFVWKPIYSAAYYPAFDRVVQVAAGSNHRAALLADGTVRAWGNNFHKQTDVPASLGNVVQIAAGGDFTLALKSDGTVVAWGSMSAQPNSSYNKTPAFVPSGLKKIVQVSAGSDHALALSADGRVVAWGSNEHGQCDDLGLSGVVQVAAGGRHSLALLQNGTVVAWGDQRKSNFYIHDSDDRSVVPSGLANVAEISAGTSHSVALQRDGKVVTWGSNNQGQAPGVIAADATDIAAGENFTAITRVGGTLRFYGPSNDAPPSGLASVLQVAGGDGGLALKKSRVVAWWGSNYSSDEQKIPIGPDVSRAADIAAGANHLLVRLSNGKVVSQGLAASRMPAGLPAAAKIAAGKDHSAIVTFDGKVRAWAHGSSYGYGTSQSLVPPGISGVRDIAAGDAHIVALKRNGAVVVWTTDGNLVKVPKFAEKIKQVGVGPGSGFFGAASYNYALGVNGTLYRWGNYAFNWQSSLRVIRRGVKSFASSFQDDHLLAIDIAGRVMAFDSDGVSERSVETTVPPGLRKAFKVAVGPNYCLVLQRDGRLRAWGSSYTFSNIAPPPAGLKGVSAIAVGSNFAAVVRK